MNNREKKLEESEEKYHSLIEGLTHVGIGIDIISNDYKILFQNQFLMERYGDFTGEICYEKYMNLKKPCDFCPMVKAIKNNRVESVEITAPDGKIYEVISGPYPNPDGTIDKVAEVILDITERKKAEEKLKESEAKYRDAYNLVSFYKDVFTHDMNNILQNILTSVELLSLFMDNPEKSEENKDILQILKTQVKRSANLILNVRKLTKLEETQIGTHSTEAISVLRKTIEFVKKSVQDREILIEVEKSFEKVFIQANELLVDIFENILLNAVKYNDNPKVEILIIISKIQKEGIKYLKMEFKDNGIGITDPAKEMIFKGGYKRDKKLRGMGLGLSLVKKIVESYNGEIWVEDKVPGDYSKGSNFVAIIPETV